jgi:hypothetical protein
MRVGEQKRKMPYGKDGFSRRPAWQRCRLATQLDKRVEPIVVTATNASMLPQFV